MANWHYFNRNGEKVGPISVAALKALIEQGLITRETVLVNHTGRTLVAGAVNGLTFPEKTLPEPATPPIEGNPFTIEITTPESTPFLERKPPAHETNPFSAAPSANPFISPMPAGSFAPSAPQENQAVPKMLKTRPLRFIIWGVVALSVFVCFIIRNKLVHESINTNSSVQTVNTTAQEASEIQKIEERRINEALSEHEKKFKETVQARMRIAEINQRVAALETGFFESKFGYSGMSRLERKMEVESLTREKLELKRKYDIRDL